MTKYAIIILLVTLCFYSCDTGSGGFRDALSGGDAEFIIVSKVTGMTSFGCPKATIIVKNISDHTGYNTSCTVQAKRGNTIMDSGFAYFANGSDIDPGERAEAEAIFFDLSTLSGYTLEYELNWLER